MIQQNNKLNSLLFNLQNESEVKLTEFTKFIFEIMYMLFTVTSKQTKCLWLKLHDLKMLLQRYSRQSALRHLSRQKNTHQHGKF